jgi:hypothetical protein
MGFKVPIFACVTPSSSSDSWLPFMNTLANTNMATEAIVQTPIFVDGTVSDAAVSVFTSSTSGLSTVYFRINGADGNISVPIAAGLTGRFYDTTNTDHVVNGDVCCWRIDRTGAMQLGYAGAYYETDSGIIVNKVGCMGSSSFATGTGYLPFISTFTSITDGAAAQCPTIDIACEAKNIWAYSSSNPRTNTVVFSDRKNAGAGGLSCTFPASTPGLQTGSGTTSIAAGDNYNFRRVSNTGSGTFVLTMLGVDLHYPANEFQLFSAVMAGQSFNATTARYAIPVGSYSAGGSLSLSSIKLYGSGVVKNLRIYIPTNAGTVAQQWMAIIGGTTSTLTTTSGISATGLFSDTTNQPTFTDGQDLSIRYLKSSGSGATTLRWTAMTVVFDVPAPTDEGNFFAFMGAA